VLRFYPRTTRTTRPECLIVVILLSVGVLGLVRLNNLKEGVSFRLRFGDFSGVGLFERSGMAVQPRVFQGAYLVDGLLDHTFLGQSLVDDVRDGVLLDNGRRNDDLLLLKLSLGHSVRQVDSPSICHRFYTGMSFFKRERRRQPTRDSRAFGLDQCLKFVVHFGGDPDADVGGLWKV